MRDTTAYRDVLSSDPPGLLVNEKKHDVADIRGCAGPVSSFRHVNLWLHDSIHLFFGYDVSEDWTGSYRVDGDAFAPAKLVAGKMVSYYETSKSSDVLRHEQAYLSGP